jgi:dolichyl-phosphate-mannose--protein O-mannosyl transferase
MLEGLRTPADSWTSPPWAWWFLTRPTPLWFWRGQAIYFIGNPAVWMGVPAVALLCTPRPLRWGLPGVWHAGQACRSLPPVPNEF